MVIRSDLKAIGATELQTFSAQVQVPPTNLDVNFNLVRARYNTLETFVKDNVPGLSEANVFTVAQSFSAGIKTNTVDTYTTGGNLDISTTSTGLVRVGDGTYTLSRILTLANFNALIGTGSVAVMTGANGTLAGVQGLAPQPAATDNVKALFGDATYKPVVRTVGDMNVSGAPIAGQIIMALTSTTGEWASPPSGRHVLNVKLSLTSNNPEPTADVSGATAVYITPSGGGDVVLNVSGTWLTRITGQLTITPAATTNTNYDVYLYDNSGVVASEVAAWTNDTTRAVNISNTESGAAGIWVKAGDITRRYLGSFRTGTVSGQVEDSAANRHVYNVNEIEKTLVARISTGTWTYTTDTLRAVNNNTTLGSTRVSVLIGVSKRPVKIQAKSVFNINSSSGVTIAKSGIGIDSTSTDSATTSGFQGVYGDGSNPPGNGNNHVSSEYVGYPGIGYHYIQQLEAASIQSGTASSAWVGFDSSRYKTGMEGTIWV